MLSGTLLNKAEIALRPADTDWSLFNNVAEHWKCAQVCLYEALEKQDGAALLTVKLPKSKSIAITTIDPTILHEKNLRFWQRTLALMGLDTNGTVVTGPTTKRAHDLLLDGPMD